jgi:hypothetical protein
LDATGERSTAKQCRRGHGSGRRLSQAGPAPDSGGGVRVWFSESGVESLVRPGGWRRLRRFAGRTGASNVACRGLTPDPATAIRAVTGSGVDAGQSGGTRSINKPDFWNVHRQQDVSVDKPPTRPKQVSLCGVHL